MRKSKANTDDGWAKNLHEWSADLERATGLSVRMVLTPTVRSGVFRARVEACEVIDGKPKRVVASQSSSWPNEKATTLYATLFQLAISLDSVLADMQQEGKSADG